jgi:S1-C subfamily serine protease
VLSVPGLGEAPLAVGTAEIGADAAVFGHPGGQEDVEVSPARIEAAINALGRDLYGDSTTRRDIYILAAQLAPGDSGGALVDTNGDVVGVAFAVAPDKPATAYALAAGELSAVLDQPRAGAVDTGSCLR